MANPSKNKGTAAETAFTRYAREHGFPHAERRALAGYKDVGDVWLTVGVIAEVKNYTLPTGFPTGGQVEKWLAEAAVERDNAGADHCILVVKRKGTTDVGQWFSFRETVFGWTMRTVAHDLNLVRFHGYGDPLEEGA